MMRVRMVLECKRRCLLCFGVESVYEKPFYQNTSTTLWCRFISRQNRWIINFKTNICAFVNKPLNVKCVYVCVLYENASEWSSIGLDLCGVCGGGA